MVLCASDNAELHAINAKASRRLIIINRFKEV